MRISIVVCGVLYVVAEIVLHRLRELGWPRITWLDVAAGLTSTCLTLAVGLALLVAHDAAARRWRRRVRSRARGHALRSRLRDDRSTGAASSRPQPIGLPAAGRHATATSHPWSAGAVRTSTALVYGWPATHAIQPYPEEPGPLL